MNLSFLLIWEPDECGSSDPIGIRALDVKLSYLEWTSMPKWRISSFTRHFIEHNGQITYLPYSSTISTTYATIYKGPWGIERLLEVDYGIWPQIRIVFCRIKDMVIFWKKIVSRCSSSLRQMFSHVFCSTDIYTYSVLYVECTFGTDHSTVTRTWVKSMETNEWHTHFFISSASTPQFISFKPSDTMGKRSWV